VNFSSVVIAIIIAFVLYVSLAAMLRRFWVSAPSEPDPDKIEPVNIKFRCSICGAEVTMTMAPQGEVPDPPRHCKEDMELSTDGG
jgi:hypothetical protein